MIVCPNCNHPNPDGAAQCEACYTPLPATTTCPNCGATVQTDATFCGQCGSGLRPSTPAEVGQPTGLDSLPNLPELERPDPLVAPEPLAVGSSSSASNLESASPPAPVQVPATLVNQPAAEEEITASSAPTGTSSDSTIPPEPSTSSSPPPPVPTGNATTQLQQQKAQLLHIQTNTMIELPQNLSVIHVGKVNDQIPPDIDVSGFPNSEVVSRIHADIRVEADAYYIEDVGSSNGTYVNHNPLAQGNRHRLRPGDRIALGKGDMVTFLFQIS